MLQTATRLIYCTLIKLVLYHLLVVFALFHDKFRGYLHFKLAIPIRRWKYWRK